MFSWQKFVQSDSAGSAVSYAAVNSVGAPDLRYSGSRMYGRAASG